MSSRQGNDEYEKGSDIQRVPGLALFTTPGNSAAASPEPRPFNVTLPKRDDELWARMIHYLETRSLDPTLARENGWYPSSKAGDEEARIVIPATSQDKGNVFWQARAMADIPKRWQSPAAPRGDAIIIVWPPKEASEIVIVEGPMDALAAAGSGLYVGAALMGTDPPMLALTQLAGLCRIMKRGSCVMDQDAPEAMVEVMKTLMGMGVENLRLLSPYPGKDLAALKPETRMLVLL